MIDLSPLRAIEVDPARARCASTAAALSELDHATHASGWRARPGSSATTGVGGLTLGGGIGHITRQYGLTVDNLLVGRRGAGRRHAVTASADEQPDLFWALRGGGGNFGVVTSFKFRVHPVSTVNAGPTLWPLETRPR